MASPTTPTMAVNQQQFAMRLSLAIGILMLVGKMYAYIITGSSAILSDAAESIVHVIAVGFAAYSLWLSMQPADRSHPYGHDKISFFSAGVEGMLIVIAALFIMYEAISEWIQGPVLENLNVGAYFVTAAMLINAGLGTYLVVKGKMHHSVILVANGKHVLTDSWTSFGVIVGLFLVMFTGWLYWDPLCAILVALNILWSGSGLVRQSIGGLMDEGDPATDKKIREVLDRETSTRGLRYHKLRHRNTGNGIWIDFHLLFPDATSIHDAHLTATKIEAAINDHLHQSVTVITHLEPLESHEEVHQKIKDAED